MKMKRKYYIALASILILGSCGIRNYSYKPTRNNQINKITPPVGMIYIPGGSVMIGRDSSDLRKVSLSPFFMDKTEITNIQYREFVNWVRDSVVVHLLNEKVFFKRGSKKDSTKKIDWVRLNSGILWKSRNPRIRQKIESLYNDEQKIDNRLLNYEFVIKTRDGKKSVALINVWPNELSWIDDFPNSQNELMAKSYFTNPIFDNHPVVGISWKQARAYAHWRSKMINRYTNKIINPQILQLPIDLPTEAQWTYASQLSLPQKKKKEDSDLYQLNFKQGEGTYSNDGSTYTSHVMAYAPNGFGLFNMAGNVSEWTLDAYSESFKALIHDLNPVILYEAKDDEPLLMQRKVVKGGSWKDAASMTDPLIRTAETQNTGRSFIGFRCVMAAPDVIQAQQPPKHMATLKNKSVKLATN